MKKHNKTKKRIKIIGFLFFSVGLTLAILGFNDFFVSFSSSPFEMPTRFPLAFIGLPLTGIGLFMLIFGYSREIHKYVKDENIPIIKETYQDLRPEIKDFMEMAKEGSNVKEIVCPKCRKIISSNINYCPYCGEEIIK